MHGKGSEDSQFVKIKCFCPNESYSDFYSKVSFQKRNKTESVRWMGVFVGLIGPVFHTIAPGRLAASSHVG